MKFGKRSAWYKPATTRKGPRSPNQSMNHPVIQSATYQDRQFQWHPSEVVPQCGAANMPVRDVLALSSGCVCPPWMRRARETATAINSQGLPAVHILVMGLTGSGKSTFIMRATGDTSIETGEGLESVTQEVKSYPMVYKSREVFLIDSPGFNDDNLCDDDVLQKIADFINNVYNLGWTIGGIIYLHDIGRVRMGNVGTLNVRVLESLTGKDNWNNISLVTNKWGTTGSPEGEALRERQLQENPKFWAAMREANCQARICRFNNTEASAKEIIDWHLSKSFVPLLSSQMVDGNAVLGETDAGLLIRKKYKAIFERNGWTDRLDAMNKRMDSAFEGMETKIAIDKLLKDLHKLKQKQMLQRAGA